MTCARWLRAAAVVVVALTAGGATLDRVSARGDKAMTGGSDHDEAPASHEVARAHGVAHDADAVRSIDRWHALGRPAGHASSMQGEVDRVVTLRTTGSDLAFEPARLSLEAGTRVRLDYVNDGVLPHNFVLLKSEDDLDALGAAAYEAEATGYVPVDRADTLIAYTALAAPGTTVSVTFEVPAPGTYTFVCLFPGHYNVMLGTLRALEPARP